MNDYAAGTNMRALFAAALANVWRNPFPALAIAVPLTTIVAIAAAMTFFLEGVERDAMTAAASFPDILLQQQVGGRTETLLLDRYLDVLGSSPGISSYQPRVWGHINYTDSDGVPRAFVLMGLDPAFIAAGDAFPAVVEKGRPLRPGDRGQAMAGAAVAAALGARVGDSIDIKRPGSTETFTLELVGTFVSDVQIYSADLILVPIETARSILGFYSWNECSDVLVYLDDPSRTSEVSRDIVQAVEGAAPLDKQTVIELTGLSFGQRSGYFHLMWLVLLVNVLLIAWSVTSGLRIGQRREIGILRALGWDTFEIMVLKLMEVTSVAVMAVLAGLAAGIGFLSAGAPGLKPLLLGWAEIYPDFPVPVYVEWTSAALLAALGILPLATAAILPVWWLAMTDPVEVIRGD